MRPLITWLPLLLIAGASAPAGTIHGIVKFTGEKPKPRVITEMLANAYCKDHCGGTPPESDRVVFGKEGGEDVVANVLVYVSKGLEGKKFDPPQQPVVIDQTNCVYVPHVVAVMTGQPVEIRNSDETLHNVMAQPRQNPSFNEGMPGSGKKLTKVFNKPELGVDLRCFMHPWMVGYVHVLDHPYFSVTSTNGAFEIKNLPPGTYEVSVKHEWSRLEPTTVQQTVTVGESDAKPIEFSYHLRPQ